MTTTNLTGLSDYDLFQLAARMRRVPEAKEPPTDEDVARGNAAFVVLYERHADRLFYSIRDRVLFSEEYQHLIWDAVQTVFLKLFTMKAVRQQPNGDLWGLLRQIGHTRARDLVRKHAHLTTRRPKKAGTGAVPPPGESNHQRRHANAGAGQLEALTSREPAPDEAASPEEARAVADPDLAEVLDGLAPDLRELVEAFYLDEVPIADLVERERQPGEDDETAQRRIYQKLHRFRTLVRGRHPRTQASVEELFARLEKVLGRRGFDAAKQVAGLRAEWQVRAPDGGLMADLMQALLPLRKRLTKVTSERAARALLDAVLFRLRLRTTSAELPAVVLGQLARVEAKLPADAKPVARELRPLLATLHAREKVAVGRQLWRIGGWLTKERKRGLDALGDLLLEVRIRNGGDAQAVAIPGVQARLLAHLPKAKREAQALLPAAQDAARWRKVFKLTLRVERRTRAWTPGQILAGLRKIRG